MQRKSTDPLSPPCKLVYVAYKDHAGDNEERKIGSTFPLAVVYCAGWLVAEDEEGVIVAHDLYADSSQYKEATKISRPDIITVFELTKAVRTFDKSFTDKTYLEWVKENFGVDR